MTNFENFKALFNKCSNPKDLIILLSNCNNIIPDNWEDKMKYLRSNTNMSISDEERNIIIENIKTSCCAGLKIEHHTCSECKLFDDCFNGLLSNSGEFTRLRDLTGYSDEELIYLNNKINYR